MERKVVIKEAEGRETESSEKNKMHLSVLEEEKLRYRSYSCLVPDIEEIAYSLDFVPKLK